VPARRTDLDEPGIVAGYLSGLTIQKLAEAHGASTKAVWRRLTAAGTPMRPAGKARTTMARAVDVARAYEAGASLADLAARYGVEARTIRAAVVAQGGTIRPKGRNLRY
jgi:transposase-like protein